jgi:ribonuclease HI
MSDPGVVRIHTDGAARGNPGPAAFAYVIERDGEEDIEGNGYLGTQTNNAAEYIALVRALEHAVKLKARRLEVFTDSDLMVNQMSGMYKVKNIGLKPYWEQARRLVKEFESVNIQHVPREQNGRADRLCNAALDGATGKPTVAKGRKPVASTASARDDTVRAAAVECLRQVAAAWARGDANNPRPQDVWEQLWSILEEGGVLRAAGPR